MEYVILSLFPGIGLLDMAFEEEWPDACIVRGPDLLWGGDIRRFHVPPGRFDGIIGGPPCQPFSRMANIARAQGFTIKPDMIPEFVRVIDEGQPSWWLMENVEAAPVPEIAGYRTSSAFVNNRWIAGEDGVGGDQNRPRRFTLGTRDGRRLLLETAALMSPHFEPAVLANGMRQTCVAVGGSGKPKRQIWRVKGHHRVLADSLRLQGLPDDFLAEAPFTVTGKQKVIGNGVPIPMGRAVARAVRRSMGLPIVTEATV